MDGDLSTYRLVNGTSQWIPYERPCKSLCAATTYRGTSCAGRLEAFGVATNCGGMNANTPSFPVYDGSNIPGQCNALTDTAVSPSHALAPCCCLRHSLLVCV